MDRTELAVTLRELLEYETGEKYPDLDESVNLRSGLELDSLDVVSLVLHIETKLKIDIESEELKDTQTVGDLLDVLQAKLDEKNERKAA